MVQHVKLARDRRKRKSRIKAAIFFAALLLILTGIFLAFKDTADYDPSLQSNLEPEMVDNVQYQSLTPEKTESGNPQSQEGEHPETKQHANTEDATSYDDELQAKDDEVDEIKPQFDDLNDLPKDAQDALSGILDVADQALRITDQFSHTVVRGDSLKDVLELSGLEDDTAKDLIAAYPELKTLRAGQQFYWILDKEDQLEYLNWLVSEKEERIYERTEDGKFKRQILEKKSIWKKEVLKGTINGSFASSLRDLGLDGRQISQLSSALQWQVSLQKLSKGTKFAILVSREYLGDKLTGQGNVEAIHIMADGKSYYGIQAANGRYYDKQGETLGKGFARYPLQRQARISSPFNPNRRHPVTGRVRPHKGVDFAVAAGGAGRYVVIRHGREYQTVYMHLSRALVRAGQTVKKGERIALTGNTGISTGPHLHYEFHINERAVNPLTVKLPGTSSGMATAERKQFLVRAKEVERTLKL